MIVALKKKLRQWFKNRAATDNPKTLSSHQIYILPSLFGWLYVMVVITILIGAVNYQLNTAYFFVFLMISTGFLSMFLSHRNLNAIKIRCLDIPDIELGSPITVSLIIYKNNLSRYGLNFKISNRDHHPVYLESFSTKNQKVCLHFASEKRGLFKLPQICIYSYYPFGLFKVWSYLYFEKKYYVYPDAIFPGFWPTPSSCKAHVLNHFSTPGDEEQHDLQSVDNPWVQASRIAWKVSAKDNGWYLKKTQTPSDFSWSLNLSDLQHGDIELKLKNLSFWIKAAEQDGSPYELHLDKLHTDIDLGPDHMRFCLRQLAVY